MTQGKIERFHQTLKQWLGARERAATIDELQAQLDEFAHVYNTQRPHRASVVAHRQSSTQRYRKQRLSSKMATPSGVSVMTVSTKPAKSPCVTPADSAT